MIELADIFRQYGAQYRQKYGEQMLPSHCKVMRAIEHCRTEALGGHLYYCDHCEQSHYLYHSCRNRHCPKCQNDKVDVWLSQQQNLLLPVPYFLVTFTLPTGLRDVARSHQKIIYNLLFRASAAALQELALDPRFVGGKIGLMGVLHTWTRQLHFHPHVHYLATGGGLTPDGAYWRPSRKDFLVHVKPLSRLFRAKFRDELKKTDLFDQVPAESWRQDWVVHSKPVGNGHATLKYLATYVFRVAISNNRLLKLEDDQVTFRYKDSETHESRSCTLPAEEFIRRFLQHVLPKGFVKVRYYGLFSPAHRALLPQLRLFLSLEQNQFTPKYSTASAETKTSFTPQVPPPVCCPRCGHPMRWLAELPPKCRPPP
jgi:hypothetical protein